MQCVMRGKYWNDSIKNEGEQQEIRKFYVEEDKKHKKGTRDDKKNHIKNSKGDISALYIKSQNNYVEFLLWKHLA